MSKPNVTGEATKHDDQKIDFGLVEPVFVAELAKVMTLGAVKYGRFNWKSKGMQYSRIMAALLRHAYQWLGGEDRDPESGCSHLAHVAANCMMLMHMRALQDKHYAHCDDIFDAKQDHETRVRPETIIKGDAL